MSQLGKILLYIALAGVVFSIGAGYMVSQKYTDARHSLEASDKTNAAALADAKNAKKQAEAAALKEADAEKKLADQASTLADKTTQLTAATEKADAAQKALDQAVADGTKAKADLAELNKQLDGSTVADIKAARDKAVADMQASQSEQKIMADNLQAAQKNIEELKKDINAKNLGIIPPGVSGKVTFVNRTWNFVVIDVGLANGVVPNGQLIVYRKNSFLGKVKVTTADTNSAVADILPDSKGDIQVGDYVLN